MTRSCTTLLLWELFLNSRKDGLMEHDGLGGNPADPQASRLRMPKGYTVATGEELLPWSFVVKRLEQAENYWLATTRPDGRAHVTPVWGVWLDGAFYFDGIPTARWARNIVSNPAAAVHLESGTDVVILEGTVEDLVTDAEVGARISAVWTVKYGRLVPEAATRGIFRLCPNTARAWRRFPEDATRWQFHTR